MSVEDRPERQLHSEQPPDWQESFAAALDRVVGLLFTHQAIGERVCGRETDEYLAKLLDNRKQLLAEHLEETAILAIDDFLAHLDHLQAKPGVPLYPPQLEGEWEQRLSTAGLHKSFTVASICRTDLEGILTDEEIAQLDDSDMERISDKMSDSYRDCGGYWESLEINARAVLETRGEGSRSPLDRY
jgi:hypothetical protein